MHPSRTRQLIGGEYYVFRDAVHNLIAIDDQQEGQDLRRLLRTQELQRLRRIRQNGLASLVYSSLENSRFAHALGAFAVARKVTEALKARRPGPAIGMPKSLDLTDNVARAFCYAALVHDVGHGPLSHVWEEFLKQSGAGGPQAGGSGPYHELMTRRIVQSDQTELGRLLADPDEHKALAALRGDILGFLDRSHPLNYLVQLLSGPLDVDRLDFMGRDTRSAGVTYGFHELDWIIRSLRFAHRPGRRTDDQGEWIVAVDGRKGLTTLIQFLEARANMYRLVYHHKTIRAATQMLLLALRRYIELCAKGIKVTIGSEALAGCLLDPVGCDLAAYVQIDDGDIWNAVKRWSTYEDSVLRNLATGLLRRELFKVVEVEKKTYEMLRTLQSDAGGQLLQKVVSQRLGIEPSESEYYFALDSVGFDVVGRKRDEGEDEGEVVWILESGRLGPRFRTIREFWEERSDGRSTHEEKYFLTADPRLLNDLGRVAGSLELAREWTDGSRPPDEPTGYKVLAPLGRGASKRAYMGVSLEPGMTPEPLVALKRYEGEANLVQDAITPNLLLVPPQENVAQARAIPSPAGDVWLAEQLWSASLRDLVVEQGPVRDLEQFFEIAVQLFRGLEVIHERGMRHTDIKPENCGVIVIGRESPRYVIGDFGCVSTQVGKVPTKPESEGTLKTRPPEMFEHPPKIGLPSDVWSLGATLYAICAREYPFVPFDVELGPLNSPGRLAIKNEIADNLQEKWKGFLDQFDRMVPPCVATNLVPCFQPLKRRSSATQILQSLEEARDSFDRLEEGKKQVARWAWQRAEDLSNAYRRAAGADSKTAQAMRDEAQELATEFKEYIPARSYEVLSGL